MLAHKTAWQMLQKYKIQQILEMWITMTFNTMLKENIDECDDTLIWIIKGGILRELLMYEYLMLSVYWLFHEKIQY